MSKLNAERAKEELKLGSTPEGFNFAVNSMMAIGLFRSQGIDLPAQNDNELSVKERNDLFNLNFDFSAKIIVQYCIYYLIILHQFILCNRKFVF